MQEFCVSYSCFLGGSCGKTLFHALLTVAPYMTDMIYKTY